MSGGRGTFMREIPFHARLAKPPSILLPELGSSVDVVCPTIRGVRRPTSGTAITPRGHLAIRAHPALHFVPVGGGRNAWLLFSMDLTNSMTADAHEALLSRTEPPPYEAVWLDPCPASFLWDGPILRSVRCSLSITHLRPLWHPTREGPPDERGYWLSSRLLPPRSVPSSLRILSPTHLQLWCRL